MKFKYRLINLEWLYNKSDSDIKTFFRFNGINKFDNNDINTLKKLIPHLNNKEEYNISYEIERIDKEFDIVKVGDNELVNIELKLSHKDLSQCRENYKIFEKYYKNININIFCFEDNNDTLYKYDKDNKKMIKSTFEELNLILDSIEKGKLLNINVNINSIYLKPDFFINKNYTLSKSQSMTKNNVLTSEEKVIIINGRAGAGKSLLALDLYSEYFFGFYNSIFLAPFKKNDIIHKELRNHFPIETIKEFKAKGNMYDVCIVDEAQRITQDDFKYIEMLTNNKIVLFGDPNQSVDNESFFQEMINNKMGKVLNMYQIIRTDESFDIFAKKMLKKDLKRIKNKRIDQNKIEILMLDDNALEGLDDFVLIEPAKSFKGYSCADDCNKYTCGIVGSKCMQKLTPYDTISRDYQNVCLLFCDAYRLIDGKIKPVKKVCYGNLDNQLYSIMTRAVDKLRIITTDISVYNYLSEIRERIML